MDNDEHVHSKCIRPDCGMGHLIFQTPHVTDNDITIDSDLSRCKCAMLRLALRFIGISDTCSVRLIVIVALIVVQESMQSLSEQCD